MIDLYYSKTRTRAWDNKLENYRKWARTPKNFNWPDENGTFN